jgi:16S rRNA G966 N2-methylase RsmD
MSSYPYLDTFMQEAEIRKLYENLKTMKFEVLRIQVDMLVRAENYCFFTGEPTGIQCRVQEDLFKYTRITDYFQERVRLLCNVISSPYKNALECWEKNKEKLLASAREWWDRKIKIEDQIRIEFLRFCKQCTEINPALCVGIYNFLGRFVKIEAVLDMSAGRGTRMLSACAAGIKYYLGVDPDGNLHENYEKIRKFCAADTKCAVVKSGFETAWEIPAGFPQKYDIMFTSPPYFNIETYNEDVTQSFKKYNSLKNWHEHFMFKCMDKIFTLLNDNGVCAININNGIYSGVEIVEPIIEYAKKNYKYLGVANFVFRNDNGSVRGSQPTWFFVKKNFKLLK